MRVCGASTLEPVEKLPVPTSSGAALPSGQKYAAANGLLALSPHARCTLDTEPAGQ